ncbi:MAG: amidohydrolase family protein, partial [Nitrososphaerota archaeon]|nr:amidohydrolase family protein [Nitrososphaerota archaeon]
PDACLRVARTELGMGADHLKIFITGGMEKKDEVPDEPQMTKEEMSAVANACRSKGTYVTAHAGGSQAIIDAVDSGVFCFEHGYVLNREAAQAIRKVNGFFVPTLSVTQTIEWYRTNKFEEWLIEKSLAAGKRHLQSVETAIEEGVTIACGTDIPPGDMNGEINATVKELLLLSKTKLGSIGALRAGTMNAAAVCRADHRLGLVEKGYAADLIAIADNPVANIECLKDISFFMKEGEIIRNDLRDKS